MGKELAIIFAPLSVAFWCVASLIKLLTWALRRLYITCGGVWRAAKSNIAKGLEAKSTTHGDAELASEKSLEDGQHFQRKGWLVGYVTYRRWLAWRWWPFFRNVRKLVYTHYEASGICIAGKGQGKTQTAIAQLKDIALRPEKDDVVMVDPAGDVRLGTEATFRAAGYRVIAVDFENVTESDWHDPITFLDTDDIAALERRIYQLVELMMPDDAEKNNEHFQEFPRLMVAGVIAYMAVHDKQNLTLYNLVAKLTMDIEDREVLLKCMAVSDIPLVRQAVTAYKGAGEKERGSFGTTMARKLQYCTLSGVKSLTQKDEFHESGVRTRGWSWEDIYLGDQPTAVYIITGLGMDHQRKGESDVARILLGTAINARRNVYGMLRRKAAEGRVRFKRGLRLFVDEAKKLGNCRAIMDANDELRKAQTTTMLCFLSARDIHKIYPDAVTLIENSDLLIFGGSKEKSWMEDVSWMAGEKTIANLSGAVHGDTENYTEQGRRVRKSDEIRRMKKERLLYVSSRLSVEVSKPYEEYPNKVEHVHGL